MRLQRPRLIQAQRSTTGSSNRALSSTNWSKPFGMRKASAIAIADSTPAGSGEQQCAIDYDDAEGIAFSTASGTSALIDFKNFAEGSETAFGAIRELLSNGLLEKTVHDLKRAIGLLSRLDITLEGVKDDTFLAAYLLDPNRSKYELTDLARDAVGVEELANPGNGWSDAHWQTAVAADLTGRTAKVLRQRILEKKLETIYSEMELPLAPLLFRMERAGLKVDRRHPLRFVKLSWDGAQEADCQDL